ncbi:hypothetical protein [Dactylosporangium sp. CA-139066]|uniref:hypothetical protein n=1 Tax=Dactylosporangium sp. CA-139066 TaxID=3239930 RepID=UPI003D94A61B
MKYTHVCPKCHASSVARVPGAVGAYGAGNNILVGITTFGAVPVSRYVCLNCGFVEEWIDTPEHLARLRQKYGQSTGPSGA